MESFSQQTTSEEAFLIVVAGGKGLRMGGDLPKQFIVVGGRPVLMHTLQRFHDAMPSLQIILVLPTDQQAYWHDLCRQYQFSVPHRIANGGPTRFHSVQNGLALIADDSNGIVGIHDGVRPFVSPEVIRRCYAAARQTGSAIPVVPVVETLRHIPSDTSLRTPATLPEGVVAGGTASTTVPRSDYRLVQTPQVFTVQLMKAASRHAYTVSGGSADVIAGMFTDDASVVEAFGHAVTLVEGNRENIKLTTPFDLTVAAALLNTSTPPTL